MALKIGMPRLLGLLFVLFMLVGCSPEFAAPTATPPPPTPTAISIEKVHGLIWSISPNVDTRGSVLESRYLLITLDRADGPTYKLVCPQLVEPQSTMVCNSTMHELDQAALARKPVDLVVVGGDVVRTYAVELGYAPWDDPEATGQRRIGPCATTTPSSRGYHENTIRDPRICHDQGLSGT